MKNLNDSVRSLLNSSKDYILILIAVVIFFGSPHVLRFLDPTAGVFDAGVLQAPIVGIFIFCVLSQFVWVVMRVLWTPLSDYLEGDFVDDFKECNPKWLKICVVLGVYFSALYIVALLSKI